MTIGVTVASHYKYKDITIPRLLYSLALSGVPLDNIRVYVGQSPKTEDIGIYRYVTYNAFEYTPLIEQALHPEFDFIHLLHDTTEVGLQYWNKLQEYAALDVDCVVNNSYCNMWLYKTSALQRNVAAALALKNISKQDAIRHEGWFHKYKLGSIAYTTPSPDIHCDFVEKDIYGNGVMRITEYHEGYDLRKFKANYGQKGSGTFNNA
jgi:hypothetical protein